MSLPADQQPVAEVQDVFGIGAAIHRGKNLGQSLPELVLLRNESCIATAVSVRRPSKWEVPQHWKNHVIFKRIFEGHLVQSILVIRSLGDHDVEPSPWV